jgi:long-chain acyl-CoA synthetase
VRNLEKSAGRKGSDTVITLNKIAQTLRNNRVNYLEYYNRKVKIRKTYQELYQDSVATLAFIRRKGVQRGQKIGIMSSNTYEWLLIDLACLFGGYILVALHAKDCEHTAEKLAKEFDIAVLFLEKKYEGVLGSAVTHVELDSLLEVIHGEEDTEPGCAGFTDNDIFTIVFTSGTTGVPKALGLRVKAIEHTIAVSSEQFSFTPDDKAIIFLPLSVFTSRLYVYGAFLLGFNVIVTVPEMILNALRIYKPTILQSVPNFFESICSVFFQQIQSSPAHSFVYRAFHSLGRMLPEKIRSKIHQKLYGEIVNYFGGAMRIMITGTAPISGKVIEFFNAAGIALYESYGLNETGILALNSPRTSKIGSVGKSLAGYTIQVDENGQLLVKSDYLWSSGYINGQSEVQDKIYREDGYIATGDIGWIDEEGFLFLRGRISEVINLSNGQKVHPAVVEKHLNNSALIKQTMITGNNRPYLAAVIVKNSKEIQDKQIREEIKRMNKYLPVHQQVKNFVTSEEPFSLANKQLTNNLKLNRAAIRKKYEKEIEGLYH